MGPRQVDLDILLNVAAVLLEHVDKFIPLLN